MDRLGLQATQKGDRGSRWTNWTLNFVAAVALPVVGIIGFAASYATLKEFAAEKGFGALAWTFPIGIDASIIGLLALDLVLVRKGKPWPMIRFAAHAQREADGSHGPPG